MQDFRWMKKLRPQRDGEVGAERVSDGARVLDGDPVLEEPADRLPRPADALQPLVDEKRPERGLKVGSRHSARIVHRLAQFASPQAVCGALVLPWTPVSPRTKNVTCPECIELRM